MNTPHNRVVLTGGIWSTPEMLESTANAISDMDFDVDVFGFADAMGNKRTDLHQAAYRTTNVTLSAGMLPVAETYPTEVLAHGAPIPSSIFALLWNANKITMDHVRGAMPGSPTAKENRKFLKESGLVIANPKSFYENAKHLGAIANFNAFEQALLMETRGITTGLLYGESDKFFRPTEAEAAIIEGTDVDFAVIEGRHNDFMITPDNVAGWLLTFAGEQPRL